MADDDILKGKRPISDADLAELVKRIEPIAGVDETLYATVLKDLLSKKVSSIRGTETDPQIKEYLHQREDRIRASKQDSNIKISKEEADRLYFPSNRHQHIPKFYDEIEIPAVIEKWKAVLEQELNVAFGVDEPKPGNPEELTEADKELILSQIDYGKHFDRNMCDPRVIEKANENARQALRIQLDKVRISRAGVKRLGELIVERFERSLALPGKLVGNLMAFSFGEAATQQTLNTFHASGDRKARTQITGFAKFDAILKSTENPQSARMIVFMKKRSTRTKLLLNASTFETTILSDLVVRHRVFRSTNPKPRWERVHEVVSGVTADKPSESKNRMDIHRSHIVYTSLAGDGQPAGRILEIQLDPDEMFRKKISMSMIKNAIEESSSSIRVATSSMDIGLIYIYFRFDGLHNLTSYGFGGNVPAFITDHFQFAMENLIYPHLLKLQISGIEGIEYASVQKFSVKDAIDFSKSKITKGKVEIVFNREKVALWAVTPEVIIEFITKKMRRFNRGRDFHIVYDPKTRTCTFDIDTKTLQYKTVIDELKAATKIPLNEFLGEEVRQEQDGAISMSFHDQYLRDHGLEIKDMKSSLEKALASSTAKVLSVGSLNQLRVEDSEFNAVVAALTDTAIESPVVENSSVIWYYDIDGKNLSAILSHPDVDSNHTRSDNIVEVYRTLGVETCRATLLHEIAANTDAKLNPSHIEMLADSLTYRTPADRPLSQDRHGLNKRGAEFTSRAHEMTTTVLLEAGLGQIDHLQSFQSQILLGRLDSTSHLSDEDRKKILKTDTFKYDYPKVDEDQTQIRDSVPALEQTVETPTIIKAAPVKALKRVKKAPSSQNPVPPKPSSIPSSQTLLGLGSKTSTQKGSLL